ncbi:MAG: DUF2914 domain-containing protein [Myxococcota bacterium]|nr:DUF2914 domain-containing protein [Myxococcota bacterium]
MSEPSSALHEGGLIGETYELLRKIGQGGMGEVWAAEHIRLGRQVAIKFLSVSEVDQDAYARFIQEKNTLVRLSHPNIVQVTDYNQLSTGTPYLVMEFLEGETLADRLKRGPLPQNEAFPILLQVGRALKSTHAQGIVHRDLKPENIFLSQGGPASAQVKVLDFGVSKVVGVSKLTAQQEGFLGTPQYMSPEQARGETDSIDHRTDLFALGIITYEMLSGQLPFRGEQMLHVISSIVYGEPRPLRELVSGLETRVYDAVHQSLSKAQSDRFESVAAYLEALTGFSLDAGKAGRSGGLLLSRTPSPRHASPPSPQTEAATTPLLPQRTPRSVPAGIGVEQNPSLAGETISDESELFAEDEATAVIPTTAMPTVDLTEAGAKTTPLLPTQGDQLETDPHLQYDPRAATTPLLPSRSEDQRPAKSSAQGTPRRAMSGAGSTRPLRDQKRAPELGGGGGRGEKTRPINMEEFQKMRDFSQLSSQRAASAVTSPSEVDALFVTNDESLIIPQRVAGRSRKQNLPLFLIPIVILVIFSLMLLFSRQSTEKIPPRLPGVSLRHSAPRGGSEVAEAKSEPIELLRLLSCDEVKRRKPLGVRTLFKLAGRSRSVSAFLELRVDRSTDYIKLQWRHRDQLIAEQSLDLQRSPRWRTRATRRFHQRDAGPWTLVALDRGGRTLGKHRFQVSAR